MNTADGPKVIEFNARFGDPEAMNVLTLLSSDLTEVVTGITEGTLSHRKLFRLCGNGLQVPRPRGIPGCPDGRETVVNR